MRVVVTVFFGYSVPVEPENGWPSLVVLQLKKIRIETRFNQTLSNVFSNWLVAGKGDSPCQVQLFFHPDGPFSGRHFDKHVDLVLKWDVTK